MTPNDGAFSTSNSVNETLPKLTSSSSEKKSEEKKESCISKAIFLNHNNSSSPPLGNNRNRSYSPSSSPRKNNLSTNLILNRRAATVASVSYSKSTSNRNIEKVKIYHQIIIHFWFFNLFFFLSLQKSTITGTSANVLNNTRNNTYRCQDSASMVHKLLLTTPTVSTELSENILETSIIMEKLPLKNVSCNNNGCVDQLKHQNKCSEALIALLQYLINDVSNFLLLFLTKICFILGKT